MIENRLPADPPADLRPLFKAWIAALLDDPARADYHEAVARTGLLPLLLYGDSCFALCPDGEIVILDCRPPHRFVRLEDERKRNITVAVGVERYPELRPLLPARPPDARACPYCRGSGEIDAPGIRPEIAAKVLRCYCGGLGWIPASDPG
jgi:hypothetical protein